MTPRRSRTFSADSGGARDDALPTANRPRHSATTLLAALRLAAGVGEQISGASDSHPPGRRRRCESPRGAWNQANTPSTRAFATRRSRGRSLAAPARRHPAERRRTRGLELLARGAGTEPSRVSRRLAGRRGESSGPRQKSAARTRTGSAEGYDAIFDRRGADAVLRVVQTRTRRRRRRPLTTVVHGARFFETYSTRVRTLRPQEDDGRPSASSSTS